MVEPATVSIRGLTKRYGRVVGVNNLDLEVSSGEIVGFLGLNGAGKTTTMRILLDLLRPTSGTALVFGRDCQKQGLAVRRDIGYLPGEMGLYPDLTGREVLDLLARLAGIKIDPAWRHTLQERFELPDNDLRRRLREYSTGMKRKLGLIQAFQNRPRLLILDEPTEGLDPLMQEGFYLLLDESRRGGATVFMSSHVLAEVDRVCDRIALLRRGELVLNSGVEQVRRLASRRVRLKFSADVHPPTSMPAGTELMRSGARSWEVEVRGPLGPLLQLTAALPLEDLEVAEAKLEDVLMKYYREAEL